MFRIAEINDEFLDEKEEAIAMWKRITEEFPETRYSMNAGQKLRDSGNV